MKRNCEKTDSVDNTKELDNMVLIKKKRENDVQAEKVYVMDFEETNSSLHGPFVRPSHHSFVEREPNPGGYSLVNPNYVGKKTYKELVHLEEAYANAANFTEANARNKINVIGEQMKNLHENLLKVIQETKRDSELHTAACNFVKKPGHTYHLYERPSGQKYFSMLSPEDWRGSSPHKFLGSWYLESDQSWTPADEMHLRYQGLNFLKNVYIKQRSIE